MAASNKIFKQGFPSFFKRGSLVFVAMLFSCLCSANNLILDTLKVIDSKHLQCTISWENSWKLEGVAAPFNHDAVWVFIKYKQANGIWQHLNLKGDSLFCDSTIIETETTTDSKGFFVKRKTSGSGNISAQKIIISLDTTFPQGDYEFKIFGVEMARVNTGSFYIGDGWAQKSFSRGDTLKPFQINSESAIKIGTDSFTLRDTGEYDPKGSIPLQYPKGYFGFYCMKYEITQEQYVDFLNCLTYTQQKNRTITSPDAAEGNGAFVTGLSNRNGVSIERSGTDPDVPATYGCNFNKDNVFNDPLDANNRACNFLEWNDIAAYLDWAALRPMSELEFEKICRGPETPIRGDFAWGTAASVDANTLVFDGSDSEAVSDKIPAGSGIASYGYLGPQGPLRAGFAANKNTDRLTSGSSYFGIMEISGNLWEMCVNVNTKGLLFDGLTGDGILDNNGNANTLNWPSTDADGAGFRGGAWLSGVLAEFRDPAISARFYAELKPDSRRNTAGGRGVR